MSSLPDAGSVTCPRCGRPAAVDAQFCASCGAALPARSAGPGDDATVLSVPDDATVLAVTDDATVLAATQLSTSDPDRTVLTPARDAGGDTPTTLGTPMPAGTDAGPVSAIPTPGDSGPLTVGDRFGRYTIVRLLGIGGMGAVYQAWDQELEVVVALKVIRPEVMRDPRAAEEIERRFKRELLLARQVTHKNVVRIHDLGEIAGIKYITMTYVDGTDLSTLLKKHDGRLPVPQVLRMMRSVVSGLVAAHAAGVVHRDLKPANIMIDADGEALIMDFGIARSTSGPADVGAAPAKGGPLDALRATSRLTEATMLGTIVGTVEYMAPEQARGQAVDQRSDIYTTGLILYDLLAGKRRAGHAGSALDQLRARMEAPLPELKSVAPDVPEPLAAIVTRATEPDAAKRYQTTAEFAEALERLDENGVPLPIKRVIGLPVMAAIVVVLLALSGGTWWYWQGLVPDKPHEPVVVVIADLDNKTGDPAFDRTLETHLKRALEGASFITAYDRVGIRRTVGARVPEHLDEAAAREVAVKQGLGFVLSGAIEKQGGGYRLSMKAVQTVTGTPITTVTATASGANQVVAKATELVTRVRKALGDKSTKESEQIFTMNSLSATSLDVVRYYAAAIDAQSNAKFEDARQFALKAIEADPNFGLGYLVVATVSRNLGRSQDTEEYTTKALSHLDGMTDRERLATRGLFYRISFDYQKCVQEYGELIKRYAADAVGHNQLALCASKLRDLTRARDEMEQVVKILPGRVLFRDNLALYSDYAGDFDTGEKQARKVQELAPADSYGHVALAMAQVGQGQLALAAAEFGELAKLENVVDQDGKKVVGKDGKDVMKPTYDGGPSLSAAGLGDLAVYEGRLSEAVRILEQGAAADLAAQPPAPDHAAAKLANLAYAQLLRGQKAAAVTAAEKALATRKSVSIRFLAARIFVEAGQVGKATPLMKDLSAEIQPEPQAYGKILEAMIAMHGPDPRPAIKLIADANALLDTWLGHFELGRAYLATKQFPQADSEFDTCIKRRGEAISLFLDEEPTYGYFPVVYYYQGLVREGLHSAGAAESLRTYLGIREKAGEDPLLADVKKRAGK